MVNESRTIKDKVVKIDEHNKGSVSEKTSIKIKQNY
jgi:hypothetical protein